jgi:hypothetical protein
LAAVPIGGASPLSSSLGNPTGPMAGHDLAFGQMSAAHQPLAAVVGELVGVAVD